MNRYRHGPRKQQGVALLATWVLVLALVITLGTIFYRHQLDVSRTARILHTDQALLLALSVENLASQMLSPDYDDLAVDHLLEDWALPIPPLPVDGGVVSGCLVDAQSLLNLNSLASYNERRIEDELNPDESEVEVEQGGRNRGVGQLSTLMELTGMLEWPITPAQIASLIDWTDQNNQPVNASGAEQLQYDSARVRLMVPNSPLENVAELSLLTGYDQAFIQAIQPYVVTLPEPTTININTAPEVIIRALGGNRADTFTNLVMQGRPFSSLTDLHIQLEQTLEMETVEVQRQWGEDRISVNTNYFMINLQVSIGSARIEVESLLHRRDNGQSTVVSRRLTRVPDIDITELSEEELLLLENPCIFSSSLSSTSREPLINSMMVETLAFRFNLQGGSRREWLAPLASGPTLQGDRKGASRLGLSALARSLRYATRPIAKAWDLRDAPRDHRQSDSNSTHQRSNQRFPS